MSDENFLENPLAGLESILQKAGPPKDVAGEQVTDNIPVTIQRRVGVPDAEKKPTCAAMARKRKLEKEAKAAQASAIQAIPDDAINEPADAFETPADENPAVSLQIPIEKRNEKLASRAVLYDWVAAFAAFCNNAPAEEIAEIYQIPIQILRENIRRQKWAEIKSSLPLPGNQTGPAFITGDEQHLISAAVKTRILPAVEPATDSKLQAPSERPTANTDVSKSISIDGTKKAELSEARLNRILQNREENFKIYSDLLGVVKEKVELLKSGKLVLEKLFQDKKSGIVIHEPFMPGPADLLTLTDWIKQVQEIGYRALGDVPSAGSGSSPDAPAGGVQMPSLTIVLPAAIAAPRNAGGPIIDCTPCPADSTPANE